MDSSSGREDLDRPVRSASPLEGTGRELASLRLAVKKAWRDKSWQEAFLAAVDLMQRVASFGPRVPIEELVGLRELRELMAPAEVAREARRCAWAVQFGLACLLEGLPMVAEVIGRLVEFLDRQRTAPDSPFAPLGDAPLRSWQDLGPEERGLLVREAGLAPEFSQRPAAEVGPEDLEWLDWWAAVKLGVRLKEAPQ